jgi:predicted metal-dependent enzyme (double-stranded beta helix superfamily)
MSFIETRTAFGSMLAEIAIAAQAEPEQRPRLVAEALAAQLHEPDLLSRVECPSCPKGYIRHLLHADPDGAYAVVALCWRPGQMSPVHAHRTWCALGVYRGMLTEGHYAASDTGVPVQTGSVLRPAGATCHSHADPSQIHRIANLGSEDALSIHVYGAAFERFGQDVNLVYCG